MEKVILVAISALLISGCSTSSQSDSEYSSNDIAFAEMMIPHHEQAIEMSEIAKLNTSNPKILQLAKQIKDAQLPEIKVMKSWTGVNASMHTGHMMDGMLSKDEIATFRSRKEKEFDSLFLQGMIKHHEGAILMAQAVVDSKNKNVANLASSIINTQELEILQMKELLLK